MKCGDFRSQVLVPAAELLKAGNSIPEAQALHELAALFEILPSSTVANVVKRLKNLGLPEVFSSGKKAADCLVLLSALSSFLKKIAKQPAAKDVDLVHDLLRGYAEAPLEAITLAANEALTSPPKAKKATTKAPKKPLREDLVERYLRRLEEALGDDPGFAEVYGRLSADPDMGSAELALLAQRFSLKKPRGRDAALKSILGRHQALMTSRARSAATAGRIAG